MKYTLTVDNEKCGGCSNRIEKKLQELEGVSDIEIDVETGAVSFESIEEGAMNLVESSLKSMGYPRSGEGGALDQAKSYVSCMIGRMTK